MDWGRQVRQDAERADQVIYTLIGVNLAVFLLWQAAIRGPFAGLMQANFTVSAEALVHLRLWTLVTYMFSQVDPMHLLFNMLALWVFGRSVGQALGYRDLLALYLGGGLLAGVGHVAYQLVFGDPSPALGASGSVMAIAVMYGALFPNRTLMINFLFPVPAWLAVTGYVVLDVLGVFGVGRGNVAHAAHLGGAAFGLALWWWRTQASTRR